MGERRPTRELQPSAVAPDAGASALRRAAPASAKTLEPALGELVPHVLLHEEPTVLIASLDDCLITVVHTLTPTAVEALAQAMNQLTARHGAFRSLAITERKTGSEAAGENRAAVSELVRKHTRSIRGAAVVSEGTGFRATAVRSMVTAIHMAGRASHPTKVFEAVSPALAWLASKRPELTLDVPRVERAVAQLRARFRAGGEKE